VVSICGEENKQEQRREIVGYRREGYSGYIWKQNGGMGMGTTVELVMSTKLASGVDTTRNVTISLNFGRKP
jgi:hypothetical protein